MKKTEFLSFIICCGLTLIIVSGISGNLSAASMVTITVMEEVEIEKDTVLLGEIADIKGDDRELVQELRAIVMGRAPLPGKSRLMDRDYIKIRLKHERIDLSQIKLQAPGEIRISRGSIEFPDEKIKKGVLDFVYKMVPWEKSRVKIGNIQISQKIILPRGDISYEIIPPENRNLLGTVPLSIRFKVNGRLQKKVWATVNIGVLTDVVVTKRPLRRYQLITENDIELQRGDLARLPSNVITDCEDVIGKRTKRKINTKAVLSADLIEFPPLVKRGDVVLIIAESEGLRITAMGKVREKGRHGDRIKVVNLDSNKGVYARVLDSNTVRVEF